MTQRCRSGDVEAWDPRRLCEPGPPRWHALVPPHGRERRTRDWLRSHDIDATYPILRRSERRPDGSHRVSERPQVSGYVFARMPGEPRWHILRESGHVQGVVCRGSVPVVVGSREMRAMLHLPEREDELRRAAEEAQRIRPGVVADVLDGSFEGFVVDVTTLADRFGRVMAEVRGASVLGRSAVRVPATSLRVRREA